MSYTNMRSLVLLGLLFTVTVVNAQGPNVTCPDGSSPSGKISVTGQGSVKSLPDSATIVLTVQVTRPNATDARETGAVAVNATLTALTAAGISADAISTSGLTLQPGYQYEPTSGTSKPTGFTFSQTLEVKLTNVTTESIGKVVDGVVAAGGSAIQVSSVTTTLSPETARNTTNSARQLAVSDALNTVSVLSQAAGVSLGPITMIADNNSSPPMPYDTAPSADAAGPPEKGTPTQYVIGKYETVASVSMEIAMCRKTV